MIEHEVRSDQQVICINGSEFVADSELIPLIRELNKVGLETTQHCSGHTKREAYISIKLKSGMDVAIRTESEGSRLTIFWNIKEKNKCQTTMT